MGKKNCGFFIISIFLGQFHFFETHYMWQINKYENSNLRLLHLWIKVRPDQDRLECQKLDEASKGKQFDALFQVPKNYVGHSLKKKFSIRWQKKFDQIATKVTRFHIFSMRHYENQLSIFCVLGLRLFVKNILAYDLNEFWKAFF